MFSRGLNHRLVVFSLTFLSFGLLVLTGDPCPSKNVLHPCSCKHSKVAASLTEEQLSVIAPAIEATERQEQLATSVNEVDVFHNDTTLRSSKHYDEKKDGSSYYTVVECKTPKSLEIVEESIRNGLHRTLVDKLVFSNLPPRKEHTLVRLPSNWLTNVRVKQLEIKDTVLSGDFTHYGNPLQGQEHCLVSLVVNNCYLSGSLTHDVLGTTNTKGIVTLPGLEIINFSRNHLVHISNMGFRYPPANLSVIILSYNSIQSVEAAAFNYAPKLRSVNLSHNLLQSITRNVFAVPARTLEEIDLSWNQLNFLPVDFFNAMPALKVVKIGSNFLYSLAEKPWAAVWKQLTFIVLEGNFLECNCDLLWLLRIISPPVVNATTTPAPKPLIGQTVIGSCGFTKPQIFTVKYQLAKLTRSHLKCDV